jgi:hypothetical protein
MEVKTKVIMKTTINYDILKDFAIRNWKNLVIVILAILLFKSCGNGNSELILQAKLDKKQAETYLKRALDSEKKNVALSKKEAKYKDSIAELNNKVSNLLADQKVVKSETKKQIEKIKEFKSSEIANYVRNKYKVGPEQVITNDFGTNIKDNTMKKVLIDVEEGFGALKEVEILNHIVVQKDEIITQKDSIIEIKEEKEVNLLSAIMDYKTADQLKSNALKNTEKAFRQEKNKKNIWKLTAIGIGAVSGYLLITK